MIETKPLPAQRTVLIVGLGDDAASFQSAEFDMDLVFLNSCRELRQCLPAHPRTAVVVTSTSLPDGNWCDVLHCLLRSDNNAVLLLCSSTPDQTLWSEAIWRGVHDVLTAPLQSDEIRRSLASAIRSRGADCVENSYCALAASA